MISVTTRLEQRGDLKAALEKIMKGLKGPTMVKVGFPKGEVPASIIHIAGWNHEGTNRASGDVFFRHGKVGISGPIPPRPFITVAMFHGRAQIRQQMRNDAAKMIRGELTMDQALQRFGLLGQDLIKRQISSNMGPPNSGMTINLKGSARTLIDTGRMHQSVTWEIDR